MNFSNFTLKINNKLYLKDPESSDLGKRIVQQGIKLIYQQGIENVTFRKIATASDTTEATVYRYFENKYRLLTYILNWYWSYTLIYIEFEIQNIKDTSTKLHKTLNLIIDPRPMLVHDHQYDLLMVYKIAKDESSKSYMTQDIDELNKLEFFRPYKDLTQLLSQLLHELDSSYPYPYSLASSIIEISHLQQFYAQHLPFLTDIKSSPINSDPMDYTRRFIHHLIGSIYSDYKSISDQ